MRAALAVLPVLCLAAPPQMARAHVEIPGDGGPRVVVEGGRFFVRFFNNRTEECFRTVVDAQGNVIEERVPENCPPNESRPELPWGFIGQTVEAPGEVLAFDGDWPDLFGNPQVRVLREDHVESYPLWGSGEIGYVQRASASGRWDVLLATEKLSALDEVLGERLPVSTLHAFAPDGFGHRSVPVGRAASIWQFAVASEIVTVGETRLFAWVSEYEDGLAWRGVVFLSMWNPDTGQCETVEVARDLVTNTSVSIAVLDGRVLVAHGQPVGRVGGRALVEYATALHRAGNPLFLRRGVMVIMTNLVPLPSWVRSE